MEFQLASKIILVNVKQLKSCAYINTKFTLTPNLHQYNTTRRKQKQKKIEEKKFICSKNDELKKKKSRARRRKKNTKIIASFYRISFFLCVFCIVEKWQNAKMNFHRVNE